MTMRDQIEAILRGEAPPPPVAELLGIRLLSVGDGECVFEMEAQPEHANPMGTVQGGVICALADAAIGAGLRVAARRRRDLHDTRAEDELPATGDRRHARRHREGGARGRTIGLTTCDVVDGQGRKIAHATSTCMTLREQR
jgi:uncharacterized protein (TIGR00369 family)